MGELEWTDADRDAAKAAWNAVADEYNQWDVISLEEAVSWMLSFARHRIASTAEAADELTALRERLGAAIILLRRYRTETPTGHQPHMIAHIVDTFLSHPQQGGEVG